MTNQAVVTGATGFLGQHLTRELFRRGFEVTLVTHQMEKAKAIFNDQPVHRIIGLSQNPSAALDIPSGAAIFHCGAITGAVHTRKKDYTAANVDWTCQLLQLAIQNKAVSFTFISSLSAVGAQGSARDPITEKTTPKPRT